MLRAHTTSLSIVLASARLTTTISSAVSRCANVRGGNVYLDTGSLRGAGDNSNYWSATTYPNTTNAYYFHFYSTNVYPSIYYNRFFGFSVRCIVFFFPFFLFLLSSFSFFLLLPSPFSLPYIIFLTVRYSKSNPSLDRSGRDLEYLSPKGSVRQIMYGREKGEEYEKTKRRKEKILHQNQPKSSHFNHQQPKLLGTFPERLMLTWICFNHYIFHLQNPINFSFHHNFPKQSSIH